MALWSLHGVVYFSSLCTPVPFSSAGWTWLRIKKPLWCNEVRLLPPATKLGQGNIFSSVCHPGQVHPRGQWADGTHPTGMHSCFPNKVESCSCLCIFTKNRHDKFHQNFLNFCSEIESPETRHSPNWDILLYLRKFFLFRNRVVALVSGEGQGRKAGNHHIEPHLWIISWTICKELFVPISKLSYYNNTCNIIFSSKA